MEFNLLVFLNLLLSLVEHLIIILPMHHHLKNKNGSVAPGEIIRVMKLGLCQKFFFFVNANQVCNFIFTMAVI